MKLSRAVSSKNLLHQRSRGRDPVHPLDVAAENRLFGVVKNQSLLWAPMAVMFALCSCGKTKPQVLDLSAHYSEPFSQTARDFGSSGGITGHREFDGVPFMVSGHALLYGKQVAEDASKNRMDYPDLIGVKVGKSFEELHLLHTTKWPDVEGAAIARVRLNYSDGTSSVLDIGYGAQVRDWQRLQSEEREAVTDPLTKVVWRGPGMAKFKSTQRMFKSVLINPNPAKRVDTIDFLSTEQTASYDLYAATVADSDPDRPVTPPVPLDRPEWKFDGRVHVRVLDEHGYPIERALVDTSLSVPDTGYATSGAPVHSSAEGTGIVKYPKDRTDRILLNVSKDGWQGASRWVDLKGNEAADQGLEITFRLSPSA